MTTSSIEAWVSSYVGDQAYKDGARYQESGAVFSLFTIGPHLHGVVYGRQPYKVTIDLQGLEQRRHSCTCLSYRSPCKHIIAAILEHLKNGSYEAAPLIHTLVHAKPQQLLGLFQGLLTKHPQILDDLDREAFMLGLEEGSGTDWHDKAFKFVDRRLNQLIEQYLHEAPQAGWDLRYEEPMENLEKRIEQLMEVIDPYLVSDRGYLAALLLQRITDTLLQRRNDLDEYGDSSESLAELLQGAWIDACMCRGWTPAQKKEVAALCQSYREAFRDQGELFDEVLEAFQEG
ncbi:MAG: SWIM zinc finger domain-containing protein [Candidatus Obscuribacterales bacterium]